MAHPVDPRQSTLQKQAITKAKCAFSRLPQENVHFQRALEGKETLMECLEVVEQKYHTHRRKKSTKHLERLQRYTAWLQNISGVVDVAVQTQAGIACPLWAPIKFVLKISDDHSEATEQIFRILTSIQDCLPRLELYESVQSDQMLQLSLLNVFVDVVDFAVRAAHFLQQNAFVRLVQTASRRFDQDIEVIIARLKEHASHADRTALAVEIRASTAYREAVERRHGEELRLQCMEWLKPSNVEHIHERNVQVKLAGTCQWILTNSKFDRWVKPASSATEDRIIVISGSQGRGKSILASSIVDGLKEDHQLTLYYAFSTSDGSRQSGEDLIRTFLSQLLRIPANEEHVNLVQRLRLHGQPASADLWGAFETIISSLAKPLFCVIDGFDECSDFISNVSMRIKHSVGICLNLRVLLTGRSHVVQEALQYLRCGNIEVTASILDEDIDAFLHDEITRSDTLSHPKLRHLIYNSLKEKADGMFLYIYLMINDLKHSSLSMFEVSERLKQLPSGLEDAYGRYLAHLHQKLSKSQLRLVQSILTFIIASCRPLDADEIRYAYALQHRSSDAIKRPLKEYLSLLSPQRLVEISGGLFSINNGFLYLSHSTIKEFLVRPKEQWVSDDDKAVQDLKIDIQEAHLSFSRLCLEYLILEGPKIKYTKSDEFETSPAPQIQLPFFNYATVYSFHHLNRSGPYRSTIIAMVEDIVTSGTASSWLDNFAYLQLQDFTYGSQVAEFMHFMQQMAELDVGTNFMASLEHAHKDLIGMTQEALEQYYALHSELEVTDRAHTLEIEAGNIPTSPRILSLTDRVPPNPNPEPCPKDPSVAVSHSIYFLQRQARLPVAHQIRNFGTLCSSLRMLRPLVDPLKVLCQSILGKAASIPAYTLFLFGVHYFNLGKDIDALGFFTAASKQVKYVDVLSKYVTYGAIGICNEKLGENVEASKFYGRAHAGFETHLGKRHESTLALLYHRIYLNCRLQRHEEVLELCNIVFQGQDTVPELGPHYTRVLQSLRLGAYERLGNHDMVARMGVCLLDTVAQCRQLPIKDIFKFELDLPIIGPTSRLSQYRKTTMHLLLLVTEVLENSQGYAEIHYFYPDVKFQDLDERLRRSGRAMKILDMLREALWRSRESRIIDILESEKIMNLIFLMYNALGLHEDALDLSRVAVKILRNSKEPHDFRILHVETWLVLQHTYLYKETEVEQLIEDLYEREMNVLGPKHQYTRIVKLILDCKDSETLKFPNLQVESPVLEPEPQSQLQCSKPSLNATFESKVTV